MRVKSKNIHVLPTTQPSNLLLCIKDYVEHKNTPAENFGKKGNFRLGFGIYANTEFYQHQNIYITSDEEIKEGDWYLNNSNLVKCTEIKKRSSCKKIILTTDQDLIKDGVWGIEDGFLEWFVKNPSCEYIELKGYAIILPGESCDCDKICSECKPKQETLEEAATNYTIDFATMSAFKLGAKWQQEQDKNKFSEEEVLEHLNYLMIMFSSKLDEFTDDEEMLTMKWFEQFKNK
jgi:hypothetical protein